MKVLVTGATGQLGSAIVHEFGAAHEVVAFASEDFDITSREVAERVRSVRPAVIVNCAAYNDVDGAEDHAVTALAVNGFAVLSLSRAAAEVDAAFVHYSTDFVFAGDARQPYTEDVAPRPGSFYAMSKLLGEWFAAEARRWYVLRVESLFGGLALGSQHRSSVDRIADAIFDGREATVFTDRTVSPTFVMDAARATRAPVMALSPVSASVTAPASRPRRACRPLPLREFGVVHLARTRARGGAPGGRGADFAAVLSR